MKEDDDPKLRITCSRSCEILLDSELAQGKMTKLSPD